VEDTKNLEGRRRAMARFLFWGMLAERAKRNLWSRMSGVARFLFWAMLCVLLFHQATAPLLVDAQRNRLLDQLQTERHSRVIAMIHREEPVSLLGVPVGSYITIEDSEAILRAIRETPPDQPIDLILHTPGGLLLAAEQIAMALAQHKGKVTVFVPHYAMSGGTLMALAADQIVMDPNAVLGPVDPQIGDMPAASIIKAVELKTPARVEDETLILADIANKARNQTAVFVAEILMKHLPKPKAAMLTSLLVEGRWTHDFPITVEGARELGLSVSTDVPQTVYDLMDLYPQSGTGRPSVLYVPFHSAPPEKNANSTPPSSKGGSHP
jgi:ClpP class serine protease